MQLDRSKKIIVALIIFAFLAAAIWYFYGFDFLRSNGIATIKIASCSSIDPSFISVTKGEPLYLINRDSKSHTIKMIGGEFTLKGNEEKLLSEDFIYGTGTYTYDCDNVLGAGQIQIVVPPEKLIGTELTFKDLYDSFDKNIQDCISSALKKDFDKAYSGEEGFVLSPKNQDDINSCLKPEQEKPPQTQQ